MNNPGAGQPIRRKLICMELFAVLCLGVFPHLVVAISEFVGSSDIYRTFACEQLTLIVFSLQVAVPTLFIISRSPDGFAKFGLVAPRLPADLCIGLAVFAFAWLSYYTVVLVPPWLTPMLHGLEPSTPVDFEKPTSVAEFTLLFVAFAVNAFGEELVMRAYLVTRLVQLGTPKYGAVAISSALFASYHLYQGAWAVYQMFFFGIVFGCAFLWVRRLLPLVIAHLLYGFIAYLQFQPT